MMIKGASNIIYKPRMVNTVSFLPTTTLKLHENIRFGAPPQHRKWNAELQEDIYTVVRYCCWSDLLPPLDV